MPAREAVALSKRSIFVTASMAFGGLSVIAATTLAIGALDPAPFNADLLRAALEALLVVVPATIVFSVYARLDLGPRTLLAATAIGLLVAGLVSVALMPLMAFISLTDRMTSAFSAPAVLLPAIALAATATVPARVIRALDHSARANLLRVGFVVVLFAAFALRAGTLLKGAS